MKYVKSELSTKASDNVEAQVQQDLKGSDPSLEEARASIEENQDEDEDSENPNMSDE